MTLSLLLVVVVALSLVLLVGLKSVSGTVTLKDQSGVEKAVRLAWWMIVFMVVVAFFCEYIDSTLGMGYGTTLTPLLLLIGFQPLQIVPVILLSELITGILAGIFHHHQGNVDFALRTKSVSETVSRLRALGYVETFKTGLPLHLKVALFLAACSIVGTVAAVFVAVNIPKFWLNMYIGVLIVSMGIVIIVCFNREFRFSWRKIFGLGLIASFNKGMSGGGYGPVVTSGQILSGMEGKSAVGITSLAEGLTCFVGIIAYVFLLKQNLDLRLAPYIIIGAVLSVPLSAVSVKRLSTLVLKRAIAIITIILGVLTIAKTIGIM
jgi:uncharacterized membrane protein YfcA